MRQTWAGAGVLVVRDDSVLMVLRERSGAVRWELPSGILEAGESFEQAAIRETLEETGVQVEMGDLLCTARIDVPSEAYRAINAYFYATALSDRPPKVQTRAEPIRTAAFVNVAALNPRMIHPVDRRILRHWLRKPQGPAFTFQIRL